MPGIIIHKVSFALRLIDTTSGMGIEDEIRFLIDTKPHYPLKKPDGISVFLLAGDGPFTAEINAKGFEPARLTIDPDSFKGALPLIKHEMIPLEHYKTSYPCMTFTGVMPGLTGLDCVKLGENSCLVREYDQKKKVLTLFNPHRLELDRALYAVVDPDTSSYQTFTVLERLSDKTLKIDAASSSFKEGAPVTPVIFGRVSEQGNYLLRVRNLATKGEWLLRIFHGEEISFKPLTSSKDAALLLT